MNSLIESYLSKSDFGNLFVGELGWDNPPDHRKLTVKLAENESFEIYPVAYKRGIYIYTCNSLPNKYSMEAIDLEISKRSLERLVIYVGVDQQIWRWPEPRKSGGVHYVNHYFQKNGNNSDIIQRLSGIRFELSEEKSLSLLSVRERVRSSFSAEEVTNRFYQDFQANHKALVESIEGIDVEDFVGWYASLLLNRLMFIYFLQKKGFLNDDLDYLKNSLAKIRELKGSNKFYQFYRDFLLTLFHDGLGSDEASSLDHEISTILGEIPYINGGIFAKHVLEETYEIEIPDVVFEQIFAFFDKYKWHLDTRSNAEPGTINPDILGYIFEKYVNQKQQGAFYTKEDVTGFMTSNTILPVFLDSISKLSQIRFDLVKDNPPRYIPEGMRFGCELDLPVEIAAADLNSVGLLDEIASSDFGLPGERWREVLERRSKVLWLEQYLCAADTLDVDDLITANIDLLTFTLDNLDTIEDPKVLLSIWHCLTDLRVIDPTCGSGAFLFAALHLLSAIYGKLIELLNKAAEQSSSSMEILSPILGQIAKHPNKEYFLWKTIVLENLYGVDLMVEATEIARLRLFLALASKLDRKEDIEPLPDLDMNIKVGNLLVGSASLEDAEAKIFGDIIMSSKFEELRKIAADLSLSYDKFVQAQKTSLSHKEFEKIKKDHEKLTIKARNEFDLMFFESDGVYASQNFDDWRKSHNPFHWFIEFPEAMAAGGFDAVIGNPPYIAKRKIEGYTYSGFETDNCPDIYAPCMERSASIISPRGAFSMIVPISFQFSEDFSKAREIMSKYLPARWVSTYSRNPASLFDAAVGVRSTILVSRKSASLLAVTGLRRWYSDFRPYLFETTSYTHVNLATFDEPWPRLASHRLAELLNSLQSLKMKLLHSSRRTSFGVGFKKIALYYVVTYLTEPPSWNLDGTQIPQTATGELTFDGEESRQLAFLITAGRLGVLWWGQFGDDFNLTGGLLYDIPIDPKQIVKNRKKLLSLAKKLEKEQAKNPLVTKYNKNWMGNYDMSRCRNVTDESDKLILDEFGLLEYWPDILFADQTLAKVTGERPGTLRKWPFPLEQ
jgi:hypothetical protein